MYLRSQTPDEKRSAWRTTLIGAACGGGILVVLLYTGFPPDLWTPYGVADFLRAFLTAALIACVGSLFYGPSVSLEDWEVRTHTGSEPIINPFSSSVGFLGGTGWIAAIVLVIRYLYLMFF